uniref:Uncharacterized protein n=1 Tax=Nelumbo nucifera TaxID=4432 RepID=A0A822ZEI2_NELNU|nr:TPA_asm: hypothetical protein HUJ06_001203 [Nelumbo nucifera]
MGTLNFSSGQTIMRRGRDSREVWKIVHGIVNAVTRGTMMPMGAMKVFQSADPLWFYLHVSCQISAYIIGVGGWVSGLVLGSKSPGIQYSAHR